MFWVIRGTDPKTDQDFAFVVEAATRSAAEVWALKRGVPYIVLDEASRTAVDEARQLRRLWKHTPDGHHTCFGRPVAQGQLACLMLAGVTTILLLLRAGPA